MKVDENGSKWIKWMKVNVSGFCLPSKSFAWALTHVMRI